MSAFPKRCLVLAVCGAVLSTVAAPLHAENAKLEEVIVTAQKFAEDLQRVPIAISAFSADDLQKKGITSFDGVAQNTPSISFAPNPGSSNTLILYMRGQGAAVPNAPSSEGGIGLYQDGFYIGRPTAITFDLAELERVEVLRGPQGTLYGRNTTGGAVNLVSRQPTGEFGFRQTLDFGTRNRFRSMTAIDLPRAGMLAAKVSLLKSSVDGYVRNAGSAHDFGEQEQQAGRLQLHWDAGAALRLDYFAEVGDIDDTPLYYQNASLDGQIIGGFPYNHAGSARDRAYRPEDLKQSNASNEAHGFTVTWDAADALTIKSLTGYRELDAQAYFDYMEALTIAPGVPFRNSGSGLTKADQLSQEFQFVGSLGASLRYVAGLYYFKETVSYETVTDFPDFFLSMHQISSSESKSQAVFGQVTWTPAFAAQRLDFTLGGRYTEDERRSRRFIAANGFVVENGAVTGSAADLDFDRFNPAFTVSYRWTDAISSYAKVATGYRAGGTYEGAPSGQFSLGAFGPEKVTSYELGLKSDWWEQRLRLNLALFESRYKDLQIYVPIDPNDATRALYYNIGEATVRGIELDAAVVPVEDLTLSLSYSYLDPEFTRVDVVPGSIYDQAANALSPYRVGDNIKDLFAMPYAPKHSVSLSADYTLLRFATGDLALHMDYRWEDETYASAAAGPAVPGREFNVRPSYGLANARLTLSTALPRGDQVKVSLWGKNIFNKRYRQQVIADGTAGVAVESPTTGFITPAGYRDQAAAWAEPASYGVQLQYQY